MEEVLKVMRFWLDMGVDALRLDAIPYLVERDGTSCENLPETHVVIKEIRAAIDADYANRLILAEANQWPTDVRPYFGDGDECHMAFHFPLMPRIYMALRQEDRLPITDIMAQTPEIPDNCQWGLFLRNHDELTLEMVTNDERDYMYLAYSADPRMRINVGIRRRLAPLMDNNRRRIELLNSLLFAFPARRSSTTATRSAWATTSISATATASAPPCSGTRTATPASPAPIPPSSSPRHHGPHLGLSGDQRRGAAVRSILAAALDAQHDRAAQAVPGLRPRHARIPQPGEPQDPRLYPALRSPGRLTARDRPLRRQSLPLRSAGLARSPQFAGMVPVEMLGYVPFPPITAQPYPLTLAPYSFLWLELQPAAEAPEPVNIQDGERTLELLSPTLDGLLTGTGLELLQQILPTYLPHQRWFGAKSRTIKTVCVLDWVQLPDIHAALVFLELTYENADRGRSKRHLSTPAHHLHRRRSRKHPRRRAGQHHRHTHDADGPAILHDAVAREDLRQALLKLIEGDAELPTRNGVLQGHRSSAFAAARGHGPLPARTGSAEQSNTSILYDSRLIMKLFRRLQPGENPDTEIGRFLTETAHFPRIAPFLGDIRLTAEGSEPITVAMLQGLVENEGDGWQWTLDELSRYYESVATCPAPQDTGKPPSFLDAATKEADGEAHKLAREHAGLYLDAAALLGRRTAEMHLALATPTDDPAFTAEAFTPRTSKPMPRASTPRSSVRSTRSSAACRSSPTTPP